MEQADQVQDMDRGLRDQIARLLHSRRVAWWSGLLALTGLAHLVALFFIVMGLVWFVTEFRSGSQLPGYVGLLAFGLSVLVALAVGVYIARTKDILRPPKERVPRKSWWIYAITVAAVVAIGVLYTTWWLWGFLLLALSYLAALVLSFPEGTPIILLYLTIPVPLLLTLWAFIAWRHETLEILETAQPPELRLATNLIRHADDFQLRARALEQAIEEAAVISKQIQSGIELEQQRLGELHQENFRESILRKLNAQEVSAIDFALAEAQARSGRRSWWWNLAFVVLGWTAGVVSQALIDSDALGDQLRQWLPLG